MNAIILYEELSMNAHPAIKTHFLDGWLLRFAKGYTNRANSVNPLYPAYIDANEKITLCEEMYSNQGLATVFKLTPLSIELENILSQKSYTKITPTNLMIKELKNSEKVTGQTIISDSITAEWQKNYFFLNGLFDKDKIETAQLIQSNIQNTIFCASIMHEEKTVACGLCVVERGYAGLFDIIVEVNHRGMGLGFALCKDMLNAAADIGAKMAYLQVVANNVFAINLYRKLGFNDLYQYWYRVKNTRNVRI